MFVPALLLRHRFLMGFQHKFWRTHLEILFLGFRGLYSVFDLLKVSFLFRQAVSFVSSLSFLERRRAMWVVPDYIYLKKGLKKFSALSYVVTHWVAGLLTNFKHVAFTHYHLSDFFYPLSFFSFSSNSFWVREAFKLQIPTVALSSSFDAVGSGVFYFIPANLRYFSTLFFFFRVFTGSILSSYNVSLNKLSFFGIVKKGFVYKKAYISFLNVRRSFFSYLRSY